jgi:predicted glutamine amidotransferase
MCGLVGCAGNLTKKEEDAFRNMLVFDSVRGEHSTGVAALNKDLDVLIAKTVGDPFQLFETPGYEQISRQKNFVLIGHNRYATTGKISRRNAHPFEVGNTIGAHNGTLTNKHSLLDGSKFDVDSEALFHHIEDKGVEDALSIARGAYALSFFNRNNNTINLVRNKERPLYVALSDTKHAIFWASEKWILSVALSRNDIKYAEIRELPEHTIMSVVIPNVYEAYSLKPHVKKLTKLPVIEPISRVGYYTNIDTSVLTPKKGLDRSFLAKSNVYGYVGSPKKDIKGALYYPLYPSLDGVGYDVRAYIHKTDYLVGLEGQKISFTPMSAAMDGASCHYRIDTSSVVVLDTSKTKEVRSNSGSVISQSDLTQYYSTCAWCSSPIDHSDDGNVYMNKSIGVLCPNCKDEPDVATFLSY